MPPQERQHEGLGGLGDSFTRPGVVSRVEGFNPLRGATTGVVMRRRATTGVDGTRGVGFCFFFGGCSGVGGGFFHTLGSGWHEGGWFLFFLWKLLRCRRGILSHAQE